MPPVRRRLFNLLTVLSLLLCVAVCGLWVRSYTCNETVGWYTNEWQGTRLETTVYGLSSDSGGLLVFGLHRWAQFTADDEAFAECRVVNPDFNRPNYRRQTPVGYPYMARNYAGWGTLGFGYYWGQRSPSAPAAPGYRTPRLASDDRLFVLPYWFLSATAAAAGIKFLHRVRKKASPSCLRPTPGRCPSASERP